MDFIDLATQCAPYVDAGTLASVVKTESNFKPYVISIDRKGKNAGSKNFSHIDEAVAEAIRLVNAGEHIGVGLGQVTDPNVRRMGLTWEQAFDPCINLQAAASILQGNYTRALPKAKTEQQALRMALSAYNTGNMTKGFTNGYVTKVVHNANTDHVPAIVTDTKPDVEADGVHVLGTGEVDQLLEQVEVVQPPAPAKEEQSLQMQNDDSLSF
jgi:type IV secretion system protein VirB1